MGHRFAADITPEEAASGFDLVEHGTGARVVMMPLGGGLLAVKVREEAGPPAYVVCDDRLQALYMPAASIEELHERFAPPMRPK